MINLEKLIPSKVVREQCIEENRTFNLLEQASLAWNNPVLTMHEKLNLLKIVLEEGKSDPIWRNFCQQIEERIEFQTKFETAYYSREEGQYYKISYYDKNFERKEIEDLFSESSTAQAFVFNYCLRECRNFEYAVTKRRIGYAGEIRAEFNGDREIISLQSDYMDYLELRENRFENHYFVIPFPFRNGDLVKVMNAGPIGIFRGCKTKKEYKKLIQNNKTYTGPIFLPEGCLMERIGNLPLDKSTKRFIRYYPNLTLLEYADPKEEIPHYKLLKEAQNLLKGKGSFHSFSNLLNS